MRFYVRKRKQTPTIIVVALIDVLIVLLIPFARQTLRLPHSGLS